MAQKNKQAPVRESEEKKVLVQWYLPTAMKVQIIAVAKKFKRNTSAQFELICEEWLEEHKSEL